MSSRSSRTIYVGNLPGDISLREVEDLFYKYGPIVDIDLKIPSRPPGYAFVEFEDAGDAEDAIHYRNGYNFDGFHLRVEFAHGGQGHSSSVDRYSCYSGSSGNRGDSRRSDYRVLVTGLPPSASWQDLKDHMRKAGDVCFSQVFRKRGGMTGIVDYTNYEDVKYAIRKLDDSEFQNAFSRAYVRVREYDRQSYSRSPIRDSRRSYSRSPSHSSYMSRSRSHSHSRSPSRDLRRSYSRSPDHNSYVSRSRSHIYYRSPGRDSRRSYSRSPSHNSYVSRSRSHNYSRSPSRDSRRSYSRRPGHSSYVSRSRSYNYSKSPSRDSRRSYSRSPGHNLYMSRSPSYNYSRSLSRDSRRSYSRSPGHSLYMSRSRSHSYSRSPSHDSRRSYSRSPGHSSYVSRSRRQSYSRSPNHYSRRSYSRSPGHSSYVSRSRSRSRSHNYRGRSISLSPKTKHSQRSLSLSRSLSRSRSPKTNEEHELEDQYFNTGVYVDVDQDISDDVMQLVERTTHSGKHTIQVRESMPNKKLKTFQMGDTVKASAQASMAKTKVSLANTEKNRAKSMEVTSPFALPDYCIAKCVIALDEIEDVSDDIYMKALQKFRKPDWREMFLTMSNDRRKAWLDRL